MTAYVLKDGREVVVCDGCGIDYSGRKPDLAGAKPVDHSARMLAAGLPRGTSLTVTDTCPECTAKERRAKP